MWLASVEKYLSDSREEPDGNGHLEDLVEDVRVTLNGGIRWDDMYWIQLVRDKHK